MSKLFADIRTRVESATEGPWEPTIHLSNRKGNLWHAQTPNRLQRYAKLDAEFIAASRTDIPKLLEAIDVMQDALKAIKQMGSINTKLTHVTASISMKALACVASLESGK